MNQGHSQSSSRPILRRIAGRIRRAIAVPFRPIALRIRDRQAPALHHYMMHEASIPGQVSNKPALIIAPHADDETFGCGGIMALKSDAGVSVHVLLLTDGRSSHTHVAGTNVQELVATRNREMIEACGILGVPADRIHFLNLPDQGLSHLSHEAFIDASTRLTNLLKQIAPAEIFVNHQFDRHPDHEAGFRVLQHATARSGLTPELFQYPIWLIWKGPMHWTRKPANLRGAIRIDVRSVQDRKDRAIQVYASQLPVLPHGFVKQFQQGYEVFFRSRA